MVEAVLEWARKEPNARIVLKMHPGEERSYYEMAADALGWRSNQFTMTNEPILYDLLEVSDVLVTGYSSTALESVMLGTPAIVCDFVHRDLLPVDCVPGVTLAYSAVELHGRLDAVRAAGKPDRDSLSASAELFEYVLPSDGKAVDRIVALVKHLVQREV
jgi:CDP-glycerol glycerophosphotransferase (TagB/SpsB family)